ncbi:MAG TPA: hypothetical protein VGO93_29220 [Candidatus Xenobia bacterium]
MPTVGDINGFTFQFTATTCTENLQFGEIAASLLSHGSSGGTEGSASIDPNIFITSNAPEIDSSTALGPFALVVGFMLVLLDGRKIGDR